MSRPVPDVDVVIPVHRLERPVERAVASVADPAHGVRAVVVCHNMDPRDLQERLAPFGEGVRILDLHDGVPSPAGPLNVGLDAARASWVTCMGSDDHEQPGAAAAWIDHLRRRPVDALVLPVLRAESGTVDVPPDQARPPAGPRPRARPSLLPHGPPGPGPHRGAAHARDPHE